MSEPSGKTKRHADLRIDETQDEKNGRAESWQGGPSNEEVRNDNNVRNINKRSDAGRTDIRTTDAHASWRQVYRACHVGVGMNE